MMFSLMLIGYGLAALFMPEVFFFFQEGWKFRNAEPSDLFLWMTRLTGLASLAFGIMLLVGRLHGGGPAA